MRKFLLSLGCFVLSMASTLAQFSVKVETAPHGNWLSGVQTLSLSEISNQLGYADAAAMVADFNDQQIVWGTLPNEELSNVSTSDPQGFWMNGDGKIVSWGDDALWYAFVTLDADNDALNVNIGMMPNTAKNGADYKTTLILKNGEKSVSIDVEEVITKPVSVLLSSLQVVKEYSTTLDFVAGKEYEANLNSINMEDVYEALGVDSVSAREDIMKMVYAQQVVSSEVEGTTTYAVSDTLILPIGATDGWFGRYMNYNEATDTETPIVENQSFLHSYGSACTFYLQSYSLVQGDFSMRYGQFKNSMAVGGADFAELYIVYGEKAAKIKVNVNVTAPESVDFSEMTKVGEQTIEAVGTTGDYATVNVAFNLEDVLAKLDCDVSEIEEMVFTDDTYSSIFSPKENNDYWQSANGYSIAWGTSACSKVYPSNFQLESGKFTLMQMAGTYTDIEEKVGPFDIKYLLVKGANYYQLNFTYYIAPLNKDAQYTCKSEEFIQMQIVPSGSDWLYGEKSQIDVDYIAELIGTSDFVLYGEKYKENDGLVLDKTTNCSDNDSKGAGFWYGMTEHENEEHQVVMTADGWSGSGENSFGFQLNTAGEISWIQWPGARQVGESYKANIYFINEETGDYVRYTLVVKYVSEAMPETETVKTVNKLIYVDPKSTDDIYTSIDMDELCEALETTKEALEDAQLVVAKSASIFDNVEFGDANNTFNSRGYIEPNSDSPSCLMNVTIDNDDDGGFCIVSSVINESEIDNAKAILGIELNGKRVIYSVSYTTDEDKALGVAGVNASSMVESTFSVNGVRLSGVQKGINIVRMSDGTVKKVVK